MCFLFQQAPEILQGSVDLSKCALHHQAELGTARHGSYAHSSVNTIRLNVWTTSRPCSDTGKQGCYCMQAGLRSKAQRPSTFQHGHTAKLFMF